MTERDKFFTQRLEKGSKLRDAGHEPYANDFDVDTSIAEFFESYADLSREQLDDRPSPREAHAVAGRVMAINRFGKAAFIRIEDGSSVTAAGDAGDEAQRLQIFVQKNRLGEEAFERFKLLDIGDIVGAIGEPMRTKTDELTLGADSLRILTKSLRPLPEKWHGLSNVEIRYRQRYVDMIANPEVRATFKKRSQIVTWLRNFFINRDFLEVETPMMHPIPGGAAARPFITHHNTLDVDLFLRIAPELYLKRLLVGGFERVFEINRNFRNEGLSPFHNPEFTMLEFYQAYATYEDLFEIGEEIVSGAAREVCGTTDIRWGEHDITFARPFEKLTMLEAIEKHGGPAAEVATDPDKARAILAGKTGSAEELARLDAGQLIVALFEHYAESKLIAPTFIYDFPASVSPLARRRPSDPFFVDRFELFVGGHELANAFSELNDPVDQRQRFVDQLAAKDAGDDEAHSMDEDYVRALEYGMPPAAGFGLGIDRLAMLLTDSASIRDVVLFPQLRPQG